MRKILIVLVIVIGWLGASPLSGPRDIKDIEVVIVDGKAPQHPFQYEYEHMLYPTVRITSPSGTGSGVIISYNVIGLQGFSVNDETIKQPNNETFILTAAHVVEDQSIVDIELYDSAIITGTVVVTDTIKDLALIRVISGIRDIRVKDIYSAQLASKDYSYYLFTPVYAVGCSLGLNPRPSQGIVTALNCFNVTGNNKTLKQSNIETFEISAPILPGNSGGPVYDGQTYQVIGIAVWVKVYNGQLITTMAGIVPIQEVYRFLDNYEKK